MPSTLYASLHYPLVHIAIRTILIRFVSPWYLESLLRMIHNPSKSKLTCCKSSQQILPTPNSKSRSTYITNSHRVIAEHWILAQNLVVVQETTGNVDAVVAVDGVANHVVLASCGGLRRRGCCGCLGARVGSAGPSRNAGAASCVLDLLELSKRYRCRYARWWNERCKQSGASG